MRRFEDLQSTLYFQELQYFNPIIVPEHSLDI